MKLQWALELTAARSKSWIILPLRIWKDDRHDKMSIKVGLKGTVGLLRICFHGRTVEALQDAVGKLQPAHNQRVFPLKYL